MKWDRTLIKAGTFKDKRYLTYFTKVLSKLRHLQGIDSYGVKCGATLFNIFTEALMKDAVKLKRCHYRTLPALKVYVHTVPPGTDYSYCRDYEIAYIVPKHDLIVIEDLSCGIRGSYYNGKWQPCLAAAVHDNKMLICTSNAEIDTICRAAANADAGLGRITPTDIFNILMTKGTHSTLEDFHDTVNEKQKVVS